MFAPKHCEKEGGEVRGILSTVSSIQLDTDGVGSHTQINAHTHTHTLEK